MKSIMGNLAVTVAATMGKIWDVKHGVDPDHNFAPTTVIIVDTDKGDFEVSWTMGTGEVKVTPWIW